jgi:hypothetical protein
MVGILRWLALFDNYVVDYQPETVAFNIKVPTDFLIL